MKKQLMTVAACGGALLLALTGCGTPAESGGPSDAATLTGSGTGADCKISVDVPIAATFSLTGAAAQYGAGQKNALEMAVEDLNKVGGVTYKLTVEDDQTDPKQAIQVFESFVNSGASIIVGPTLSNTAKQTDPVAQDGKTPVLGVSNTAAGITQIGDYIFRDSLTEDAVIPQTVKAAVDKLDLKKVVVMYSNDDAFTESGYQAFAEALKDEGVAIARHHHLLQGGHRLPRAARTVKKPTPTPSSCPGLIDAAVPLVTQAREIGINTPIIGGNGFNYPP